MPKRRPAEALSLAEELLRNIELSELAPANLCLKAARLARLLHEHEAVEALTKLPSVVAEAATQVEIGKGSFRWEERPAIATQVSSSEQRLQQVQTQVYQYVLSKYYGLKFGSVPEAIFERTRTRVDAKLAEVAPTAVQQFISVHENLTSTNSEDWANAVHSCRRILRAVADQLYPPNPGGLSEVHRDGRTIQVGPDNYVNRLMCYVQDQSASTRFHDIVGSHLSFLGDRLDAIYGAATKGSHAQIETREEAERYIVYTYLLLGDILALSADKAARP